MALNIDARAYDLYRDLDAQRATLSSYADALFFVTVRQTGAPAEYNEPLARKLWEIAVYRRGYMDPAHGVKAKAASAIARG